VPPLPRRLSDDASRLRTSWTRGSASRLTIENKGAIPRELRAAMGDWVFWLRRVSGWFARSIASLSDTRWPEFRRSWAVGPRLDLVEVLSIASDDEFLRAIPWHASHTAQASRTASHAAVVAANVGATAAVP